MDPKVQEEKNRAANEREQKARRRFEELVTMSCSKPRHWLDRQFNADNPPRLKAIPHYLLLYLRYVSSMPLTQETAFFNAYSILFSAPTETSRTL